MYLRWIASEANLADRPSRGVAIPGVLSSKHDAASDAGHHGAAPGAGDQNEYPYQSAELGRTFAEPNELDHGAFNRAGEPSLALARLAPLVCPPPPPTRLTVPSALTIPPAASRPAGGVSGRTGNAVLKAQVKVKRSILWTDFVAQGAQHLSSFLASQSVKKTSSVRYRTHVQALLAWLAENGQTLVHSEEAVADQQIAGFMDVLFFEGEQPDRGQHALNGVFHHWPKLKALGPKALPLCSRP